MIAYFEKVIQEIPAYLGQFANCLFHPKTFIATRLNHEDQTAVFEKSISYIILSFFIALFLAIALPGTNNPLQFPLPENDFIRLGSEALLQLFYLLGAAAIAIGLLRLFGSTVNTNGFFALVCYFCGSSLILLVFANAITSVAMADPFFAQSWVQLENFAREMHPQLVQLMCAMDTKTGQLPGDNNVMALLPDFEKYQAIYTEATQRTLYQTTVAIQALAALTIVIWLFVAWTTYTNIIGVSLVKSLAAAFITFFIVVLMSLIVDLASTGASMKEIYQHCE